jgi:hypothetical protein
MSSDVAYAIVVTSQMDMSDFGIKHGGVKLKTIKLVFAAFPLSTARSHMNNIFYRLSFLPLFLL